MTESINQNLDPSINKCVTCGLSRIYTNPEFDTLFVNIGKLYKAKKINYKINRIICEPGGTIFCTLGLPQAMKIDESCQFHQPKLDYSNEHYSTIYSATQTNILTEETKILTLKTNLLAEDTKLLTAKTKRLSTIAIFIAIGIGMLQSVLILLQIHITSPGWFEKAFHNLLTFFYCR
jgi:hypothetical protein